MNPPHTPVKAAKPTAYNAPSSPGSVDPALVAKDITPTLASTVSSALSKAPGFGLALMCAVQTL